MNTAKRFAILMALFSCVPLAGFGDVLMLKDGQAITGKLQGADQSTVSFSANGQTRKYPISDINSITFTPSGSSQAESGDRDRPPTLKRRESAPPEEYSGPTPSPSADYPARASAPPPPPAPAAKPLNVTVHEGSVITVRMIDPVDSATDQVGQTYRASLDEPLVVDGQIVVNRGADVTAKLVSKNEAGRIKGRSDLSLVLLDITANGVKHEISTSEVEQAGSSRGRQTAERVGIGAALGAAIGAIAGGGKGAAIGAGVGGGAGGAVQVMTHGDQVKIPPETRLEFTLASPLNL